MANETNLPPVTISSLPRAGEADLQDLMEITQKGASRSLTLGQLAAAMPLIPGPPADRAFIPPDGYTAKAFDHLVISTADGPRLLFLPTNAADFDYVIIEPGDLSWGDPHILLIDPQGIAINGIVDTLTCDVPIMFQVTFRMGVGWTVYPLQGPTGPEGPQGIQGEAMASPSLTPVFVADAYTMTANDIGKTFVITTGATDKTITLINPAPSEPAGDIDGRMVAFIKTDSGAGVLVIKNHLGVDDSHLMSQNDFIRLRVSVDTWQANDTRINDVLRAYTATDTWIRRPRLTRVRFFAVGGGGGGGSGRKGAAGSARFGGGAGGIGAVTDRTYHASQLPIPAGSSVAITFGGAGTGVGGAAISTNDTDGLPGSGGVEITISTILRVRGGAGGAGGTATTGGGGASQVATDRVPVSNGPNSSATATAASGTASGGAGAGGAGGGISTANVAFSGGNGASSTIASGTAIGGGGSGAPGVDGTDGNPTVVGRADQEAGSGGGGGGGGVGVNGGRGGNGGLPGGSGGGGGAADNTVATSSGKGGDGAGPRLILTEFYAR